MHRISRHEGVDEAVAWLRDELRRRDIADNYADTDAAKALRTAISSLMALDEILDQAEVFANMHCNCH